MREVQILRYPGPQVVHRVRKSGGVGNPLDVLEMSLQSAHQPTNHNKQQHKTRKRKTTAKRRKGLLVLDEFIDSSSAVELPLQFGQSPAVTLIEFVDEISAPQHTKRNQNPPPVPAPETPKPWRPIIQKHELERATSGSYQEKLMQGEARGHYLKESIA